jgi:hypothetical protein
MRQIYKIKNANGKEYGIYLYHLPYTLLIPLSGEQFSLELVVVIGQQDLVNFFGENLSMLIGYRHKVMILLNQSI